MTSTLQPGLDPEAAAAATAAAVMGLGTIVLLIVSVLLLFFVIVLTGFLYYISYTSLARIPPRHRQMEPAQEFLLLVPFFNFYRMFVVHTKIPQSFQANFRSIGRADIGDCGEQLGLWTAIVAVCNLIPCVNCIMSPATIVMLVMMLFRFWSLRDQIPEGKYA